MFYLAAFLIAGLVVGLMTRRFPPIATRIAVIALVTTVVGAGFAMLTGNLLALYLAGVALPFGLTVLFFRCVFALRRSGGKLETRHQRENS